MIAFRHADRRFPFLWESAAQPAARWHDDGDGPVQYLADTPNGAWAEFLRHEAIVDPEDLATIERAIWAVEIPDEASSRPRLQHGTMIGGLATHVPCRAEANRLRERGAKRLEVPSAALKPAGAGGQRVSGRLVDGPPLDARTIVLFGARPDLVGWQVVQQGRPAERLLERVRHL